MSQRPLAMDDLDRIMAVMDAAFSPEFGEAWTRQQVEDSLLLPSCHYRLIDAEGCCPGEGNAAAGFALSRRVVDEEELLLIAITPQYRKIGLGSKLLAAIMDEARANGCHRMFLEMRSNNSAESLYLRAGFLLVGTRPAYYHGRDGNRFDAVSFAYSFT